MPEQQVIICEPRPDCADPHVLRWHCMRGFDGAADDESASSRERTDVAKRRPHMSPEPKHR